MLNRHEFGCATWLRAVRVARVAWSYDSFDTWFLDFAYSAEGLRLVRRAASRFGLGSGTVDDLRQEWVLAVRRTIAGRARESAGVLDFVDANTAASYATQALRNKAVDMLRKDRRTPEPVDTYPGLSATPSANTAADGLGSVSASAEAVALEGEWCEAARREITKDLHENRLRCPGCTAPRVAQIALYAVNVWCDRPEHEPLPPWAAEIQGGTRELDQLIYQALLQIFPEHVERTDGRLTAGARKMKQRCGDCVRELLGDVAGRCHTATAATAKWAMDGRDHV